MQMPNTVYVKDERYEKDETDRKDEKDKKDEKDERKRNCTTTPNLLYELRRGSARWRADRQRSSRPRPRWQYI